MAATKTLEATTALMAEVSQVVVDLNSAMAKVVVRTTVATSQLAQSAMFVRIAQV